MEVLLYYELSLREIFKKMVLGVICGIKLNYASLKSDNELQNTVNNTN